MISARRARAVFARRTCQETPRRRSQSRACRARRSGCQSSGWSHCPPGFTHHVSCFRFQVSRFRFHVRGSRFEVRSSPPPASCHLPPATCRLLLPFARVFDETGMSQITEPLQQRAGLARKRTDSGETSLMSANCSVAPEDW